MSARDITDVRLLQQNKIYGLATTTTDTLQSLVSWYCTTSFSHPNEIDMNKELSMKDHPVARSETRSPSRREFLRGSSALTLGALNAPGALFPAENSGNEEG